MDKGITEATTSPARRLPKRSTKINITIKAPSIRFLETVPMAQTSAHSDAYKKDCSDVQHHRVMTFE